MNRNDQCQFVGELCCNVEKEIRTRIEKGKIPENWDGIELRWYIAEKFKECITKSMGSKTRKREYNNTVLVDNL